MTYHLWFSDIVSSALLVGMGSTRKGDDLAEVDTQQEAHKVPEYEIDSDEEQRSQCREDQDQNGRNRCFVA